MKRTLRPVVALLLLIPSGLAGCGTGEEESSGAEGLRALRGTSVSDQFNDAYWDRLRREDPEVWDQAKAHCDGGDVERYPNCRPVLSLMVLERTLERTPAPSPGFDASLDMGERRDAAQRRLDSLRTPE